MPITTTPSDGFTISTATTLTVPHTSDGRPLYVLLSWYVASGGVSAAAVIDSVTFNGEALAQGGQAAVAGNTMEWWRLPAHPAATANVVITLNTAKRVTAGVVNVSGWPSALADHLLVAAGDDVTPPPVVVASRAGAEVLTWIGFNDPAQFPAGPLGATELWSQEGENVTGGSPTNGDQRSEAAILPGAGPTVTVTWSGTVTAEWFGVAALSFTTATGRHLLTGTEHVASGSNNVVAGELGTVEGNRSVLFNLDGTPRTLIGDGKFEVYGEVGGDVAAAIHHTRHEAGGADAIKLDDLAAPDDTTDLDATTSAHGLLPKLSGLDVEVLRGDGTWGNSPLTSGVFAYVFNTVTTAPPASQRIRFNAGHPYTAVTKLWADFSSSNSEDLYWGWMRIRVGSLIIVQDKDNHLQFAEFTTTGVPIDLGTYVELPVAWVSNGTALAVQAVLTRVTAPAPGGSGGAARRQVTLAIDGGGAVITPGVKAYLSLPVAGTWKKWRLLADVSGSIVIDVRRDTYANYPPTGADSIAASAKPTLSAAVTNEDATLTGWTTAFSAGDVVGFNVDSASTVTQVTLTVEFE